MSLLTICQAAARRIGIPIPTAVFASSDLNNRTMVGFANEEGINLMRRHPWRRLITEKTFTSVAAETQTDTPIATDFDRMVDGTFFNRSMNRPLMPINVQQWQQWKATTAPQPIDGFRIRGTSMLLMPVPAAGLTYAYEYVSKNWCTSSGGTGQSAWAADGDLFLIDDELMTLGIVWRFLNGKGLNYAEAFRTYELQVMQRIAKDGQYGTIRAGDPPSPFGYISPPGNWYQ